jgi:hypothetical protein
MSGYVNVGVRDVNNNSDIPTKKELKGRIDTYPAKVELYATDAMTANAGLSWIADDLPVGVRFSVTGPNPYTSRKWYATVEKLANGTIKVS